MERQKLIKPITILKYKKFIDDVQNKIHAGGDFSMDRLCGVHSLTKSAGKAMADLGMIARNDEGKYIFTDYVFHLDKSEAIQVIEKLRVSMTKKRSVFIQSTGTPSIKLQTGSSNNKQHSPEEDINLNRKSLKTPEIAIVLEKIFSKMNDGKQSDIFNGIDNLHNERIHVASAISAGVWGSLGLGQDFPRMSEEAIREVNAKIVFTASDLMDQVLNFKRVK